MFVTHIITSYLQDSIIILVVAQIYGAMLERVVKCSALQDTIALALSRKFLVVVGIIAGWVPLLKKSAFGRAHASQILLIKISLYLVLY